MHPKRLKLDRDPSQPRTSTKKKPRAVIKPKMSQPRPSPIKSLPPELIIAIAQELSPGDMARLARTSQTLNKIVTSVLYRSGMKQALADTENKGTIPPLHSAILQIRRNTMQTILQHGYDVNYPWRASDKSHFCRGIADMTALHLAVTTGAIWEVKYLLRNGAEIEARCCAPRGSPRATRDVQTLTSIFLATTLEMIQVLHQQGGADLNAKEGHQQGHQQGLATRVLREMREGWEEIITYLAENGANLNARDGFGETPLSVALYSLRWISTTATNAAQERNARLVAEVLLRYCVPSLDLRSTRLGGVSPRQYLRVVMSAYAFEKVKELGFAEWIHELA